VRDLSQPRQLEVHFLHFQVTERIVRARDGKHVEGAIGIAARLRPAVAQSVHARFLPERTRT
jgi:hypothetical protein